MTRGARTSSDGGTRRKPGPRRAGAEAEPVLDFMRLMWAVDHELQSVSKRMVGRLGLTAPQRLALRFVGRSPELSPGELATLLHLDPGTVTGIVARLESSELVARARDATDSRRVHLTLTPKGRRLDRRRRGTVEGAVRRALDAVTPDELEATSRVMRLLAQELAAE